MSTLWILCVLFSFLSLYSASKLPLNDFITHYEPLNYAGKPKLYRRAAKQEDEGTPTLEFNAHGRNFKLNLRPDTTTLAPGAQILDGDGKEIEFDKESLSVGEVLGEPGSFVHGVLDKNGRFTGKIYTKDSVYFVEAAHNYFDKPTNFHSVIYKEEDIEYDIRFAEPKQAPHIQTYFHEKDEHLFERDRRAAGESNAYEQNTCFLSMEADFTFLEMAKAADLAVGEILKHVQALNIIYGVTFNTSATYSPYSIQFQVGFLQVYNKEQTPESLRETNIDISTFLSRMSRKDYSKFCDAVYFTHRDFEGGILGLAWIGYAHGRAGGMCDPRNGRNSYNTAVVTFTLYGKKSPPKVSEITFAHEVGHSFGAEHDDDDDCAPGGYDGNYIMYSKATSGDRDRNSVFSTCSINKIMANVNAKRARVIDHSAKPKPRYCLESLERMLERGKDLCGNGVVEGNEECDCGPKAYCEVFEPGKCCNWDTCKLNKESGVVCSPSQGPCCDKYSCKPVSDQPVCEQGNDCLKEAKCPDSTTLDRTTDYTCPQQKPQVNGKTCEGGALLCRNGSCSRSICTKYNFEPCECKERDHECNACCIDGGVCQPAHKIKVMERSSPYNYSIGRPCANTTGYCDFFHYCQRVDMDGPLLQLFKLYFTAEGIRELTRKYWWAILLATLGLVGIVVLLVVFGARYTESNNPELNEKSPHKPLPCLCCKRRPSTSETDGGENREFSVREHPKDELL